jgi:hypothetical protein
MDNPRTHAEREAAQRADEAELQASLLATLPPMDGGAGAYVDTMSAWFDEHYPPTPAGDPAYVEKFPPMAGSSGEPRCIVCGCAPVMMHGGDFLTGQPLPAVPPVCEDCWPRYEHEQMPADCTCPDHAPTAPPTEHTHHCPTCRHDRSCACTVFTPGEPLECATCSNCRGW